MSILLDKPPPFPWTGIYFVQSVIGTTRCSGKSITIPYVHGGASEGLPGPVKVVVEGLKERELRMVEAQFEFLVDDDGEYWLLDVRDICVERVKSEINPAERVPMRMSPEIREAFLDSLEYHSIKPKSKRFVQLQLQMSNHYSAIKKRLSIDETISSSFQFEVPEKNLPYIPKERSKDSDTGEMDSTDARNTRRTIRRLSFFQTSEFKTMKSPRIKGRNLFNL